MSAANVPQSAGKDARVLCPGGCGHGWPHDERWGCLAEVGEGGSGSVADAVFCGCRCTGAMRFFLAGCEITGEQAEAFEKQGRAKVVMGGSGVVPERYRQPGESRDEWLRPWMALEPTPLPPVRSADS